MDYVEKLRLAKEALESGYDKNTIEYIFPELAESKDEKIKKSLIRLVKAFYDVNFPTPEGFSRKDLLDWIENQGKPIDILADTVLDSNKDGLIADTIRCKREKQGEQKPAEWSEEDETKIKAIEALCDDRIKSTEFQDVKEFAKEIKDWLKSLKDRYTWKPSKEQVVALDGICSYIRNKAEWEISQDMVSDLYNLSEQLKKLREE